MKKAQESISFMITIGIVITIFIALASIITTNYDTSLKTQSFLQMRSVNEYLANMIYEVYMSGDGSRATIELKELSENYTIFVRPLSVNIIHDVGSNTHPTYAPRVINTTIKAGLIEIKNKGGVINVTQLS